MAGHSHSHSHSEGSDHDSNDGDGDPRATGDAPNGVGSSKRLLLQVSLFASLGVFLFVSSPLSIERVSES